MCDLSKKHFIGLIIVVVALTGIVTTSLLRDRWVSQNHYQVTVTASAKIFAKPDIAQVSLSVQTEREETAESAVSKNSEAMNKIIEEIKSLDIEEKDIKTTNYSLRPDYDYLRDEGRVLRGYTVYQQLTVKIRDLDNISKVIGKATESGANQIGEVRFTIDDTDELRAQARDKAIEKTQKKAKDIAKKADIDLGDVVGFWENTQPSYEPYRSNYDMAYGMSGEKEIEMPNIQTGEQEIEVEVSLTYKVK